MANPPPIRPWFRLANVRTASAPVFSRPAFRSTYSAPSSPQTQPTQPHEPTPLPQPQPQPQPQPHIAATYRGSAASSPDKKVVPAPSSSLPSSPIQKASLTNTNHYSISSLPSSPSHKISNTSSSEKTLKAESVYNSPIHSPKLKLTASPPSPLILPPSQFNSETKIPKEAEQKTVLVQKTIEKPKHMLSGNATELLRESGNQGNSHNGKGKESETKQIVSHKKVSAFGSEDSGMNVITIAGENRGAYMELVHSQKKHEQPKYLHKKGNDNSKINDDGVESEGSSNGIEGNSGRKDKNHRGKTTSSFPMSAYMNSNVQCVNNSLLYHASCSHHNPGVHLSLSKKPHGEEVVDGYNS